MNKVCVYAIAKNESQFVDTWAESVKTADHVIVLDTGSTDDTVSKLKNHGFEVHEKTYDDFRFDVARNDCLDLVPDEYNIRVSIDLDEVFEPENWADILREKWDESRPRVEYNYVWQHTSDGKPGLQFYISKIHGKDPNYRWSGAVHEHLKDIVNDTYEYKGINLTKEITVHHYPDWSKDRLFYKDLSKTRADEDNTPFGLILYGNEERLKGDPALAAAAYEECLEKFDIKDKVQLAGVYFYLGDAYRRAGDGVKSMVAFSNGIAINKQYRDNYYGLANILFASKMYEAAIGILEEALKTTRRFYCWMEDNFVWTYAVYSLLGSCYFANGNLEKALINAMKALSYESTNPVLIKNYQVYKKQLEDSL